MITLKDVTLLRGGKILFAHATTSIFAKEKVGVVGLNGCGKSSLFALLRRELLPDGGDLDLPANLKIAYLAQETPNIDIAALPYVISGDRELSALTRQLKAAEKHHDGHLITILHNRLYELGGYNLEARAAKIMVGLGFKPTDEQKAVNTFSGGWRMRLNLAQVLMSRADLLLLDEPTNYLDLDAIVWLERWLQSYDGTLLLISHDRDFLDQVITKVISISNSHVEVCLGNYSNFEKQRAEKLVLEQNLYKKQQAKIEHLNKFINRFRAKATKARQAQSRLKALEKMELVSITRIDSPFAFQFCKTKSCSAPLLSLDQAAVAYGERLILEGVNFSLGPQDAIGLLGMNGAGKSTFMKTLAGVLKLVTGTIIFNRGVKIGYFAQHQIDQLDLQASPLLHILRLNPEAREHQIRTFLGGFGFSGDTVLQPITNFSGGEKARLVLALLIWQKPNLLLLDEPTNHLDLEMRAALTYALQDYSGALVLVAHDRYLLRAVVDEFYLVGDHRLTKFTGDLDDYEEWLVQASKNRLDEGSFKKTNSKVMITQKRKSSKVNAQRIKLLEKELKVWHAEKERLASVLAKPEIYLPANRARLEECLKQGPLVEKKLKELEENWFKLQQ